METKYSIARWKLPIIRWALLQLAPLLPALASKNFETMAKFGIADMVGPSPAGDYAIYLSEEKYVPEKLDNTF